MTNRLNRFVLGVWAVRLPSSVDNDETVMKIFRSSLTNCGWKSAEDLLVSILGSQDRHLMTSPIRGMVECLERAR